MKVKYRIFQTNKLGELIGSKLIMSKEIPLTRNVLQAERKLYQMEIWIYRGLKSVRTVNIWVNIKEFF